MRHAIAYYSLPFFTVCSVNRRSVPRARGGVLTATITMRPTPGGVAAGFDFGDAARMAAEFAPVLGGDPAGQRRH